MFGRNRPKTKRYPDLELIAEGGGVRALRTALRMATSERLVTAHVKAILSLALDETIKRSEDVLAMKCPYGLEDPYGFDKKVFPCKRKLNDIEQFALRKLLIGIKQHDLIEKVPNKPALAEIISVMTVHIEQNGGIDQVESYDNLAMLHPRSRLIYDYLCAAGLQDLVTEPPIDRLRPLTVFERVFGKFEE